MSFVICEKCGKKLIERKPNGIWVFKFGAKNKTEPVVEIEICGSLKMKCLKKTCRHENVLNFFPNLKVDTK